MGEGRSDRNLYAHGGAARRRNQGGDRGSAPTLGSKCRDPPGRPGEARAVGPGGQGGTGRGGAGGGPARRAGAELGHEILKWVEKKKGGVFVVP